MRTLACAMLLIVSTAANAESSAAAADRLDARQIGRWSSHIGEASARFGIPEDWIMRVMRAESGGRTMLHGRPITSRAGAMGLMQLMPGTWAELRAKHDLGPDPHDPRDNILAGAAYLRALYDRFGYPGLFAAYNAGPSRYADRLATSRPLPAETIAYFASVGRNVSRHVTAPREGARASGVFVALLGTRQLLAGPDRFTSADSIFVPLSTAKRPSSPERRGSR